jgi:glycosyltransferase involved in cell wall biosynthesis
VSEPRVLFVTGEYPPLRGGISDYTALLRDALTAQGVASLVLSSPGAGGDDVLRVESWDWSVLRTIRQIVREHKLDIVHVQYQAGAFQMHPALNLLPVVAPGVFGRPVVTTFHDLRVPYLFPKAGRLRPAAMLRMARASTVVIVTNPPDERTLMAARIASERIPLGPSLPRPAHASEPTNIVGYFGFPSREKGYQQLILALATLPRAERAELLMVGADSPAGVHGFVSPDEAAQFAADHGVRLRRTGYLRPQRAADALASCAVIAFPFPGGATRRSSALISTLELGRPVVSTVVPEYDDLGELASLPQLILISPGDIGNLAQTLREAITHPPVSAPLPDAFGWQGIAARHLCLYQQLSERAG